MCGDWTPPPPPPPTSHITPGLSGVFLQTGFHLEFREEYRTVITTLISHPSSLQIKAVVINERLEVTAETHVHFDSMLPEYRTAGGVHSAGRRVTAPTIMWVHALDMMMDKLRVAGVEFSSVAAISGAGQQHGSVYWRRGAAETLSSCQPDKFLHQQLASAFSVQDSPVWMDSSTTQQCRSLEEAVGGPGRLSEITGSRAYERFTASQIAKVRQERPEVYNNTERISLVSSFAASLFTGRIVGIDWADAGGMNLLDITSKSWHQQLLDVSFLTQSVIQPSINI